MEKIKSAIALTVAVSIVVGGAAITLPKSVPTWPTSRSPVAAPDSPIHPVGQSSGHAVAARPA